MVVFNMFQLTESDQELYKNFPMVVSERWQQEVAETVFEAINADTDKIEQKKKQKPRIDDLEEGLYGHWPILAEWNSPFLLFYNDRMVYLSLSGVIWASTWENLSSGFVNNKGQGLHRLEKYLNLEGFLEKSLKIKFALKSTGKSLKILEKSLNSTIFCRT